jgi:ribosome recycling factor
MAYNFNDLKQGLKEAEEWLTKEFSSLRTGRATPALLDGVQVDSYGSRMNISAVANMTVEDARTIRIAPWDMSQATPIEKAITVANLGVSVIVDDKGLRVIFPELTSERRTTIIRIAKEKLEDAKVRSRQEREKTLKDIQSKEKAGEMSKDEMERMKVEIEKIVKETTSRMEEMMTKKEKEINQ